MRTIGREMGLDLDPHLATQLGSSPTPDLVLAMESHHLDAARSVYPELDRQSVILLTPEGIADPYGHDIATYRSCANAIARAIDEL